MENFSAVAMRAIADEYNNTLTDEEKTQILITFDYIVEEIHKRAECGYYGYNYHSTIRERPVFYKHLNEKLKKYGFKVSQDQGQKVHLYINW